MFLVEHAWGSEETWVTTEHYLVTTLQIRAGASMGPLAIDREKTVRIQQGIVTVSHEEERSPHSMRRGHVHVLPAGQPFYLHAATDAEVTIFFGPVTEPEFLIGEPEIIDDATAPPPRPAVERAGAPVVVVAEDDLAIQDILVRALSATCTVYRAHDGAHALALLEALPPVDLVIADAALPWLDGLELLRHLKADAARARVPVILLSSRAASTDVAAAINAGARAYVTKPFKLKDLLAQVDKLLARRQP